MCIPPLLPVPLSWGWGVIMLAIRPGGWRGRWWMSWTMCPGDKWHASGHLPRVSGGKNPQSVSANVWTKLLALQSTHQEAFGGVYEISAGPSGHSWLHQECSDTKMPSLHLHPAVLLDTRWRPVQSLSGECSASLTLRQQWSLSPRMDLGRSRIQMFEGVCSQEALAPCIWSMQDRWGKTGHYQEYFIHSSYNWSQHNHWRRWALAGRSVCCWRGQVHMGRWDFNDRRQLGPRESTDRYTLKTIQCHFRHISFPFLPLTKALEEVRYLSQFKCVFMYHFRVL